MALASAYAALGFAPRVESALERLTKVMPDNAEAWYDLSAVKAQIGKPNEALPALKRALELSAERLKRDPKARDLLAAARKEDRFAALRQTPEFKALVPP
jgi:DNA-binding SARP family transcriptional activator